MDSCTTCWPVRGQEPQVREALIIDPKKVLDKQFGHDLGKLTVKSVIETPDTMYIVVPYVQNEGECRTRSGEHHRRDAEQPDGEVRKKGGLNLLSSNVNIELG